MSEHVWCESENILVYTNQPNNQQGVRQELPWLVLVGKANSLISPRDPSINLDKTGGKDTDYI